MPKTLLNEPELCAFAINFDTAYEDAAVCSRGEFLQAYPLARLKDITLDEYVIGKGTASFCAWVEPKTKEWAIIQGATASKFGIYYGKIKSDPKKIYRFTPKFGTAKEEAFNAVKAALLNLVKAGQSRKFQEIDDNPLSQMFKAKILSLYFPHIYLNVCSSEHIEIIASALHLKDGAFVSEYQHLLYEEKLKNKVTKDWSNPKFMSFLYAKFIRKNLKPLLTTKVKKPLKKTRRRVNFDDLQASRDAIGKASEQFALGWEKNRLIGLGYEPLVHKIEDRRDTPSYGYDFLSFSEPGQERYIEVKSLGRDWKEDCLRFFISENELATSKSDEHSSEYYFYLVSYGKDGVPQGLFVKHGKDIHSNCEISPCVYIVRFDLEDH